MNERTQNLMTDLCCEHECPKNVPVEVIVVAHNRADLLNTCLKSIRTASNVTVHVWDNASEPEIAEISRLRADTYFRSEKNIGFILPNNCITRRVTSPYTILLNSDVILHPGWKESLIGPLVTNENIGIVGFQGQKLDHQGRGYGRFSGKEAQFVSGWSMAMRTRQAKEFGPFDKKLEFALYEDADLCLRMQSCGLEIRALEVIRAEHIGNGTWSVIKNKEEIEKSARSNQAVFVKRWKSQLGRK